MSTVPIVYLPGAGGRSSFWRPVADRLWRHGAPIALGYPGFGDVQPDASVASLDDLYRAIRSILPQRFHLVAQSMGNVLALRFAIEEPERVASLSLCALTGGIDVQRLGGAEWRASLRREQGDAPTPVPVPTWLIDDATDFTRDLGGIRIPALALCGDADPLSPPAVATFLAQRLQLSTSRIVSGGTHAMAYEEADRIAAILGPFIGSASPSGELPR